MTSTPSPPSTVLVAIGNSDDRLTQADWAAYHRAVDAEIRYAVEDEGGTVHGRWASLPTSPYQNAAWSFTPPDSWAEDGMREYLRDTLAKIAGEYAQDSVAWTEGVTVFLPGLRYPMGTPYTPPTRPDWQPGRWWRVVAPGGSVWAETSSEDDARARMRPGDRLQRLWQAEPLTQWRDA